MGDLTTEEGYDETVQGIFVYGTLRPDYFVKGGDAWGVTPGCTAFKARAHGFRLYQQRDYFYPFTKRTGKVEDVVQGYLLTWPGDAPKFKDNLQRCDMIEGYNEQDVNSGLYVRTIVKAYMTEGEEKKAHAKGLTSPMRAYIYHQNASEATVAESTYYPKGDWFEDGKNRKG